MLKGSSPVQQTTMRGKAHNNGTEANGHTNNHNHHNNSRHGQSGSAEVVTTSNGHSHHQRDHRDALENVKPNLHSHSGNMSSMQNGNNMQSNNSSQRYFNGHPQQQHQQQQNHHYQENGTKKDNHHPFSHSNDNGSNQKNGLKPPKDIVSNGKVEQNGCNGGQQMRRVRNRSESSEPTEVQQFVSCNGNSGRNVKVADQIPCANGGNGGSTHQPIQLLGSSVEDVS